MTTTNSPTSPFIFVPNGTNDNKDILMKTQPFYSVFYHTGDVDGASLNQQLRKGAATRHNMDTRGRPCYKAFIDNNTAYFARKEIPFSLLTEKGSSNLYFLMVVFVCAIVIGSITFSYWAFLLGDTPMRDDTRRTLENRSLFLSVFFVLMVVFLSLMIYEYITLKFLSLRWFRNYQAGTPTRFYDFLLNTRKIFLWGFLAIWLAFVLFITITISKRPEVFKNQIAVNVVSIVILFISQYIYYKSPSRMVRTFCLFLNVFIVGLVVFLLGSNM